MGPAAPRLDGVTFGVLALGDTAYAEFCAIGKAIDARLAELGAKRAVDRVDCDLDFDAPAADWIKNDIADARTSPRAGRQCRGGRFQAARRQAKSAASPSRPRSSSTSI